jgi:CHAD domain-containing protein
MIDPARKAAHALTYLTGTKVYEWKQSMEIWIMSNPVPHPPYLTMYNKFKHDFIEAWTNTNEPHHAAAELHELRMKNNNVDTYITVFAELARKALYKQDDPAVLEIFKSGLPLKLLKKCMHFNEPQN